MKKINLISTLKKTFKTKKTVNKKNDKLKTKIKKNKAAAKTKKTKSVTKSKKAKVQKKVLKSVGKQKILKTEKKNAAETNTNPLRIPKNNEQKPEIKKVKKQDTEKKE